LKSFFRGDNSFLIKRLRDLEITQRRFKPNKPTQMYIAAIFPLAIILLVALLYWIFNYEHEHPSIPYTLLSIIILILISGIAWLIYQLRRRSRRLREWKETPEIEEIKTTERNIDEFHMQLKTHRRDKALHETLREVAIIKFSDDITGQHCSISKSKFTPGEEVLQCPYCRSLFKRNYLIEWLVKNDICPVCRYKIVVRT
jgi:hypothetical protein